MLESVIKLLGMSGFAADAPDAPRRVAVIGGGIAGLSAAVELAGQGAQVSVFEAGKRMGGHIHTVKPEGIGPVERGAEVVNEEDSTIRALCERYGVELANRYVEGQDEAAYFYQGKRITQEQLDKDWKLLGGRIAELQDKLRDASGHYTSFAREMDGLSMDELLESLSDGVNPAVIEMIKGTYRSDCGQDTSRQSALALLEGIDGKAEDFKPVALEENFVFKDGSGSLIRAMAQDAKDKGVQGQLGSRLVAVDGASGDGVSLTFEKIGADGKPYHETQQVDEVVLALPLHALRGVRGLETLGLPDEQLKIIREAQYTNLVKMTFEVKSKPWEKVEGCCGDVVAPGTAFQQAWVSSAAGKTQKPLVTMLVGGSGADEHGLPKLIEQCRKDYAAAWEMKEEDIFADMKPVAITDWRANGCYASPGKGQYAALAEFPRVTAGGKVAFAGCYLPAMGEKGSSIGYMECGAKSGLEAAKLLEAAKYHDVAQLSATAGGAVAGNASDEHALPGEVIPAEIQADSKWQDYVAARPSAAHGVTV